MLNASVRQADVPTYIYLRVKSDFFFRFQTIRGSENFFAVIAVPSLKCEVSISTSSGTSSKKRKFYEI